jgi:phosphotransferase system enzyme I (PtsI)
VAAFVCEEGSLASHTAILARTLGIPAVMGVENATSRIAAGTRLIVDGRAGSVVIEPSRAALQRARRRRRIQQERFERLLAEVALPTVTPGPAPLRVTLAANIELPDEVPLALQHGAQGIGLYRTEYLYLDREVPPSVDELTEHYRSVVRALGGRTVTFRTIDVGGDKLPRSIVLPVGRNPALGLRGVRFSLHQPALFDDQVRAILRAAATGPVRLMLPLISGWHELDMARRRMAAVAADEGVPLPPVGVMIETPASVAIVDLLCRDADFLSLGTNDLVQYTLAIDRTDEHVAHLYTPLHPAILRMLRQVAETAAEAGTELSVCGEMAGDPLYVPILLGLGITHLSMAPPSIPAVAALVRRLPAAEARAAVQGALALLDPDDIERLLQRFVAAHMGDLVASD